MDIPKGEKLAMIGAAVVLVGSMLQVAVDAADVSRLRARTIRGETDNSASGAENFGGSNLGEPTPQPTPVPSGLKDFNTVGSAPSGKSSGGSSTTRAANPGPVTPPRAGKYTYVSGDGSNASDLVITDLGGGRFREDQEGADQNTQLSGERKVVTDGTYASPQGEDAYCNWEPDLLVYSFPFEVGKSWSSRSSCTVSGTTPARLEQSGSSKVIAAEIVQVGGKDVDVWVIESAQILRVTDATTGQEFITLSFTTKDFFSPAHGVSARVETRNDNGSFAIILQNLDPK